MLSGKIKSAFPVSSVRDDVDTAIKGGKTYARGDSPSPDAPGANMPLTGAPLPAGTTVYAGCNICGGNTYLIRGKHPGDDKRQACPTCLQERLDQVSTISSSWYGVPTQHNQ